MNTNNSLKSKDELIREQLISFSIKMRDAALLSAERRQAYEWKFCILIWTAIGSVITTLLIKKVEIYTCSIQFWVVLALSVAVIIVVGYFQEKCRLANQVDKRRSELYEGIINASIGIAGPDYSNLDIDSINFSEETQNWLQAIIQSKMIQDKRKEVEKAIKNVKDGEGKRSGSSQISIRNKVLNQLKSGEGKWSRNSQILITFLLLVAFWVIYSSIQ